MYFFFPRSSQTILPKSILEAEYLGSAALLQTLTYMYILYIYIYTYAHILIHSYTYKLLGVIEPLESISLAVFKCCHKANHHFRLQLKDGLFWYGYPKVQEMVSDRISRTDVLTDRCEFSLCVFYYSGNMVEKTSV